MQRHLILPSLLGFLLILSGCLYDNPPSGPVKSIDTWLVGQWATQDRSGHDFSAVVSRTSSDHYHIAILGKTGTPLQFDGWLSQVDDFSILVVKSLNEGSSFGKYALYHYELLAPAPAPPGGVGLTRIRLSELQLEESCQTLDAFRLRSAIRNALKNGTLLPPHDVVADLKQENKLQKAYSSDTSYLTSFLVSGKLKTNAPSAMATPTPQEAVAGSIIWTKTGGVTLKGEAF